MTASRRPTLAVMLFLSAAVTAGTPALAQNSNPMGAMGGGAHDMSSMSSTVMDSMSSMKGHDAHLGDMKNMALHMVWTPVRPATEADKRRAAELVASLRKSLAKYRDYRVAEAAGFEPLRPELKKPLVHFNRIPNLIKANYTFDPASPTSLLYKRTPDGGLELVGAMFTASSRSTPDQLNDRIPLSIARWHRHVNLCFPPRGVDLPTADWTKFGSNGSIVDRDACRAAGGLWAPQLFGWMVHVYPWEKNPQDVWAH
jgi:hypothetical protein